MGILLGISEMSNPPVVPLRQRQTWQTRARLVWSALCGRPMRRCAECGVSLELQGTHYRQLNPWSGTAPERCVWCAQDAMRRTTPNVLPFRPRRSTVVAFPSGGAA